MTSYFARHLLVLLLVLCVASTGCRSTSADAARSTEIDRWSTEFVDAHRLDREQRRVRWEELLRAAPTAERARHVQFELARDYLSASDVEEARRRFQWIADASLEDGSGSRALYELARIAWDHDNDTEGGRALLHQTIVETAPWAGSEFALAFLIRRERSLDREAALLTDLAALAERAEDNRIAAQLHLHRGLLLDELGGQPNEAISAFRSAYNRCTECSASHESLYQMGQIYTRHQRWDAALQAYGIVAARTQRSFFVGTYNAHRASDSRLEMGLIELFFLEDHRAAAAHFQEYMRVFPHGTRAPEIAWFLVGIERDTGSARSYRRALERFLEDYPRSRYAPRARTALESLS